MRSFWKICFTCASTVRSEMKSRRPTASFERPSATRASTSRSRSERLVDRIGLAPPREQPRDDRRVDDRLARGQAPERLDEDGRVGDALLEEVAGALGALLEQPHREARLDVLREHEHRHVGMALADSLGGDDALVRARRGHADVDDRAVGPLGRDRVHERVDLAYLGDDVEARVGQHADDPLAGEHHVLGDDDAHGPSLPRLTRAGSDDAAAPAA